MHYKFPTIHTIDDVLPAIKDREEFIVAERDFGYVINYVVATADTFNWVSGDDANNALRRECRGLIFDKSGKLISRPFHKFFNVNEREETQAHLIDLNAKHVILEKMDGSMIRPIIHENKVRLATKMGITDTSKEAEEIVTKDQLEWMAIMIYQGVTPLFEYISPKNRIVIDYDREALVLLALRVNLTGEYLDIEPLRNNTFFPVVPAYGSVTNSIDDYIAAQRTLEGREGDVIRFADGHMMKIKNDWYVRIHKTKDIVSVDRNIIELVLNEEIDDVLPLLMGTDIDRVKKVEHEFWEAFSNCEGRVSGLTDIAKTVYDGDKKRVALELVPNLVNKQDSGIIFKMLDGHDVREVLLNHCKKNIGSTPKYETLMGWMKA